MYQSTHSTIGYRSFILFCLIGLLGCKRENDSPLPSSGQKTPWNIEQIGGFVDMSQSSKTAWILDTGVDLDHPDLNIDRQRSRSFVPESPSLVDAMSHGTHVAGIIGAKNNDFGVVGVAAGIRIVSVKVIYQGTRDPSGNITRGLEYVLSDVASGDVVNMSYGFEASVSSGQYEKMRKLIQQIADKGAYVVFAAGNSSRDMAKPPLAPTLLDISDYDYTSPSGGRIFAVAATNRSGKVTFYSNYGTAVKYLAPGGEGTNAEEGISSTIPSGGPSQHKEGEYSYQSGTSQAAPHVAGILLVNNGVIPIRGTETHPGDRKAYPVARLK